MTKFKVMRIEADLTQQELARRLGVSESQVSRIETGRLRPRGSLLQALAEVMGDEVRALFESDTRDGRGAK